MMGLCDLENFDLTRQVPAEYLHLVCLGLVRNILKWSLDDRVENGQRRYSNLQVKKLEDKIRRIKVPSEFSRRTRNELDIPNMKGTELRNFGAFFFLIIASTFQNNTKLRQIWIVMGYLIRLYILSEEDFTSSVEQMCLSPQSLQKRWYALMQNVFGTEKLFYNYHIFGAHAHLVRRRGPFTKTSTFKQEHLYGRIKKKFGKSL